MAKLEAEKAESAREIRALEAELAKPPPEPPEAAAAGGGGGAAQRQISRSRSHSSESEHEEDPYAPRGYNFELPGGYVLWFHAQALPEIYALSSSSRSRALLTTHPRAPVTPPLPVGVFVDVDDAACDVALLANPRLQTQIDLLCYGEVSEDDGAAGYKAEVSRVGATVAPYPVPTLVGVHP